MPARRRLIPLTALLLGFSCLACDPVRAAEEKAEWGTDVLMKEVGFDQVPLRDVVDYLNHQTAQLNAVFILDRNVPEPSVTLRAKKISIGQFIDLLTAAYPSIGVTQIAGAKGTMQVFHVHLPAGQVAEEAWSVSVYRLTEAVSQLMKSPGASGGLFGQGEPTAEQISAQKAARKNALNAVLSFIKAALTQMGPDATPPVLQLHEETQMLIFKGSRRQQGIVEDSLAELSGSGGAVVSREKLTLASQKIEQMRQESEVARVKEEVREKAANEKIAALDSDNRDLRVLIERLREQASSRTSMRDRRPTTRPDSQKN